MIHVTWERNKAAQNITNRYLFTLSDLAGQRLDAEGLRLDSQKVLEEFASLIGWSAKVWEILSFAFSKRLTRSQTWDLNEIPLEQRFDFYCAAEIYKRGVSCLPPTDQLIFKDQIHSKGSYEIEVIAQPNHAANFDIVDSRVFSLWNNRFSFSDKKIEIKCDEKQKNLSTVLEILKKWKDEGKPEKWRIVGGGLLLDLAQFAASLVGCETHLYPTTLLSMVDASIGGKCGVNLKNYGKNQIGRIYFPAKVVIWSNWLSSLPASELLSGVGECLKHAMIAGDRNLFREVVTASSISREKDENYFKDLLTKLINIKADICQKDPFEMNVRNYLNLGHTLAHALEAEALERDHTLSHGQAVAYGLQFCLLVAKNLGEIKQDDFDYYWQGILNAKIIGHPSATLALSKEQLMSEAFFESLLKFILQDKKNLSPQQTFQWIVPCTKNPSSLYAVKQVTVDEHFIKKIWFDEYSPFLSKYY